MLHYTCQGGCRSVSDVPGPCGSPNCPRWQTPLVECECADGEHERVFAPQQRPPTVLPGRWRHFKGGEYLVLGVARHSESREELVVYKGKSGLWVRPLSVFTQQVEVEGKRTPRFEYVGPAE